MSLLLLFILQTNVLNTADVMACIILIYMV
jgi:hypothetical protein